VRSRRAPLVDGAAGRRALALADRVMEGILDHARRVQLTTGALEGRPTGAAEGRPTGAAESRPTGAPEARPFTPQETR
jgi:hypothetical protein